MTSPEAVREVLKMVHDPEIPAVSIVDLGMVGRVVVDATHLEVSLLPTFVGCPAQAMIAREASQQLAAAFSEYEIAVAFNLRETWSTDRISDAGRDALRAAGIAPPGRDLDDVSCPFCGEQNAVMENLFASTSCRSLYYCRQCRNPFEAFKPL